MYKKKKDKKAVNPSVFHATAPPSEDMNLSRETTMLHLLWASMLIVTNSATRFFTIQSLCERFLLIMFVGVATCKTS